MSILTRRRAVLARTESVAGTDALLAITETQRRAYGLLAANVTTQVTRERTEQANTSGTLSPQLDLIGLATATVGMQLQLRGSGASTRDPEWARMVQACGYQQGTGTLLAATTIRNSAGTAGGRFIRGEQVYGKNTLASATWDSVLDSGNGLGTTPSVGDTIIAFADADSEAAPVATGLLIAISGTAVTVQVTDAGPGRILTGYFLRANAPGGTLRGYMDVTDDQPVLIVCDESHDHGANTASLWGYLAQGAFGNSMIVVGQQNGVVATLAGASASTAAGKFLRPDSTTSVSFTVGAWSGATPVAGDELIKVIGPGRWLAACQVLEVNGATITVRVYYGEFESGDVVYQATTLSSATLASDQVAVSGSSVTIWDVIDGFLRGITGCRGSFTIDLTAGQAGTVQCDMQGVPDSQAMTLPIEGLSLIATQAPRWEGGVADFLGIPLRTVAAQFASSSEVVRASDANSDEGTLDYRVASRATQCTWTVHRPGHKGWQIESAIENGSWRPMGVKVGTAANNLIAIVVPRMQLTEVRDGDDQGILTAEVTAKCLGIAGDDELIIFWR